MPSRLPPKPCIEVKMHTGGKGTSQGKNASSYRRHLPNALVDALTIVRQWADSAQTRRRVVLWCFSRGAAWGLQICSAWASLIDFAWLMAGYPSNDDYFQHQVEARVSMQCDIPMVLINFIDDASCNDKRFPQWFLSFRAAAQCLPSSNLGYRKAHFFWFEVTGNHDTAFEMYSTFAVGQRGETRDIWASFWDIVSSQTQPAEEVS